MLTAAGFDLAQTDRLLTTTRSVRKRLDLTRPVQRAVVLECLRIALQAPSGGNSQPGAGSSSTIQLSARGSPSCTAEATTRTWRRTRRRHGRRAARTWTRSSTRRSTCRTTCTRYRYWWSLAHCSASRRTHRCSIPRGSTARSCRRCGTSCSRCAAGGLGSAYTTLHLNYEREAAQVLGIPETVTQVAMIPVAYYTGGSFKPAVRRPVEQVVYVNRWRQKAGA